MMLAHCASVASRAACLLSSIVVFAAPPEPSRQLDDDDAANIAQGGCPGSGHCCAANGTPGCDDFSCCNLVCGADSFCCSVGWDQGCADLAGVLCDAAACPPVCPGTGDCCQSNVTPGCDNAFCCDLVCTQDAFCCEGVWTRGCADLADILCPDLCLPTDPCPGQGDCCLANDTVGCNDQTCCETICAEDSFCCTGQWDSICATLADVLCVPLCAGSCPSVGDCCAPHAGGGCDDAICCDAVCSADPSCCSGNWGPDCVTLADSLCPDTCGGSCPGEGSCCETHATSGCSDPTCCETVCATEPFCCFLGWGLDCVSVARDFCGDLCTNPPVCPGEGDCCLIGGTPGCDEASCCERVCAENPACCSGTWDATCVAAAGDLCGLACQCPLFGDFDGNGMVDLADVAWFQRCFTGPDGGPVDAACTCGDAANDGDIDLVDFRAFYADLKAP